MNEDILQQVWSAAFAAEYVRVIHLASPQFPAERDKIEAACYVANLAREAARFAIHNGLHKSVPQEPPTP